MEDADIKVLLDTSERLVSEVAMEHRRYLFPQIEWDDRLVCIKGPKGTGKTTMMLQRIREAFGARSEKAVYLPADHIWFSSHDMLDAVEYFHTHGYTHLFIDEIHHLPEWSKVVKTITDSYPRMNVVYSGSSILKLSKGHADLSRRQAVYCLKGLSFREFLSFEGVIDESALRLEDIVANHRAIAGAVCDKAKILPLFTKYLSFGYYPFYREDIQGACDSLTYNVIDSLLTMFYNPVIWSGENQLTADTIYFEILDSINILADLRKSGFIAASLFDEQDFNQIKGLNIIGHIRNRKLVEVDVIGNAECLYYIQEDDNSLMGVNSSTTSEMKILFENNEVQSIIFYNNPNGNIYPDEQLDAKERFLKDFRWLNTYRSLSPEDIFHTPIPREK